MAPTSVRGPRRWRRAATIALTTALIAIPPSCAFLGEEGSGAVVSRRVPVTADVDRIEVDDAFSATIRVGAAASSGSVRIDDNLVDRLRIDVDGDTLSIELDGRVRNATLELHLSLDRLERLWASGASRVRVDGVVDDDLGIDASGASSIDIPAAELDELVVGLSGASRATLGGSASTLDAEVSGASRLASFDLATDEARVAVSGAGEVELTVEDELEATASGASSVRYEGDPDRVISDVSGSSSVSAA